MVKFQGTPLNLTKLIFFHDLPSQLQLYFYVGILILRTLFLNRENSKIVRLLSRIWLIKKEPDPIFFGILLEVLWAPLQATQPKFFYSLINGWFWPFNFHKVKNRAPPGGPQGYPLGVILWCGDFECYRDHLDQVWSKSWFFTEKFRITESWTSC